MLIGAVMAVVLVALVKREDRVAALYAVADVLAALFPWRALRRPPRPDGRRLERPSRADRSVTTGTDTEDGTGTSTDAEADADADR